MGATVATFPTGVLHLCLWGLPPGTTKLPAPSMTAVATGADPAANVALAWANAAVDWALDWTELAPERSACDGNWASGVANRWLPCEVPPREIETEVPAIEAERGSPGEGCLTAVLATPANGEVLRTITWFPGWEPETIRSCLTTFNGSRCNCCT